MGNKTKPLVTVIMPAKKPDIYFTEAIKSILNQTYENIEIIVVIDKSAASAFESANIDSGETNLRYIESNISGLGPALNCGIVEAKGEYIARMDADDIALPARIEKQVEFLVKSGEADVVSTNAIVINELGDEIAKKMIEHGWCANELAKQLQKRNVVVHPSVLMRASKVREIGGYAPVFSEDFDLWSRFVTKDPKSIVMLDECLIKYRVHSEQLSTKNRASSHAAVCVVLFRRLLSRFEFGVAAGFVLNMLKYLYCKAIEASAKAK